MLLNQAMLEEKFSTVCVEDGIKMTPLEDEFISEEARMCALDTKANIKKLIREFTSRENLLKLKSFGDVKSAEFVGFQEGFTSLQTLYNTKLTTPLEEVNAITSNKGMLKTKINKLSELYQSKKDQYDKYLEECSKSKEIRDNQIKILKDQVT